MKHTFNALSFVLIVASLLFLSLPVHAQKLRPVEGQDPLGVGNVNNGFCVPVSVGGSEEIVYKPAKRNKRGKYKDIRKQLRKIKKKARGNAKLKKRVKRLRKEVRKTNQLCQFYTKEPPTSENAPLPGGAGEGEGNGITPNGQLVASFFEIPDLLAAIESKAVVSPFANDVSGIPVSAKGIRALGADRIFWEDGVIAALDESSPSQSECSEFAGLGEDGTSGGLSSCYLIEDTIYPMELFIRSQRHGCYLGRAPSRNAIKSGAVRIISGSLPQQGVEALFDGEKLARTLRAEITHPTRGELVSYARVHSAAERKEQGNIYAVELWGCADGGSTPESHTLIEVDFDGILTLAAKQDSDEGIFEGSFAALLKGDPEESIDFDVSQPRVLSLSYQASDSSRILKSHLSLSGDSEIASKIYSQTDRVRQSFAVHRYTARDLLSYRVYEGAGQFRFFDETETELQAGLFGTEFRRLLYASAPSNRYVSEVQNFVFSEDPFFSESPTLDVDLSSYSCSAPANITISVDLTNVDLEDAVRYPCEVEIPERTDFCSGDDSITAGETNLLSKCSG